MDQVKIGKFISDNRKSKGMTQAELAEQLGITNKAVSKWETGKCLPDAELFQPLCGLLGITVNELLLGEAIPPEHAAEKAEETIVSLAEERQRRIRWKQVVKYAAILAAAVNVAANLTWFVLPALGMGDTEFLPWRLVTGLEVLFLILWGAAMELNRNDKLLQWVTLACCGAVLVSVPMGCSAAAEVWRTFSYGPVIWNGLPCFLLFAFLIFMVFGLRPGFYACAFLAAVGMAASARNLISTYKKRKKERA